MLLSSALVASALGCASTHTSARVTEPYVATTTTTTTVQTPAVAVAPVVTATTPAPVVVAHPNGDIPGHDWHDPGVFAARVRRDADEVERDVVRDVRRGELGPQALGDVRARRAYIEQMLSQYSADGFIHRDERRHVEALVDSMHAAKHRYPQAFGGGPR
jgi:hypothetical protein